MPENDLKKLEDLQRSKCRDWQTEFAAIDWEARIAIGKSFFTDLQPKNGLRIMSSGSMTGWYLFAGESMSDDPDHFDPYCATHLVELAPDILVYPGLPVGWRFLHAPEYEDVWFDPNLIASDRFDP